MTLDVSLNFITLFVWCSLGIVKLLLRHCVHDKYVPPERNLVAICMCTHAQTYTGNVRANPEVPHLPLRQPPVHARLHECSLSRTFAAADTRAARRHAAPRRCAFPEAGRGWAREGSADRTPLPAKRCTRLQALQLAPVPVGADHHQRRARRGSRQRLHLFTRARCEELPSSVAPRRSARESTVAPPA